MFADFHFLNPLALLALIPLALLVLVLARRGGGQSAWHRVVDAHLLRHLLVEHQARGRLPLILLALAWFIGVLALANPTFERMPTPVFRSATARVVVLDLSRSMNTPDVPPSRFERARYKVADVLARTTEGQVGLVVYAADAFVVSPLSDDAETVRALLDALSPDIMPLQGSRPDRALDESGRLLRQAGAKHGEVVLIADDGGDARAFAAARGLVAAGHRLAVIGVGTDAGATIPGVRDEQGLPVQSSIERASLERLARAGGGAYADLSIDDRDLDHVLSDAPAANKELADAETATWRELGPWLVLALLPLGAAAFRRGWLLMPAWLVCGQFLWVAEPTKAWSWDELWQRTDQRADGALRQGDFEQAAELASDPLRRGAAAYRLGDYDAAADAFAAADSPDAHYNRGNALARAGLLEDALAAYDAALERAPDMADAAANRAAVEAALEQQQQQQPQAGEEGSPNEGSQENSSDEGQSGEQGSEGHSGDQGSEGGEGSQQQPGSPEASEQEPQSGEGSSGEQPQQNSDPAGDQGEMGDEEQQASSGPSEQDQTPDEAGSETQDAGTAAEAEAGESAEEAKGETAARDATDEHEFEEQQVVEQWLRRIPDDPAGLLRNKFEREYRERSRRNGRVTAGNPW